MRKNNVFVKGAEALGFLCPFSLLLSVLFIQPTACTHKQFTLHYVDTLSVLHDIGYVSSYYSPVENSILNTYYYVTEDGYAVLNYCKNSILPNRRFKHRNYIQNYIIESDSTLIIQFPKDSFMVRINNQGTVKDTMALNTRVENEEAYVVETFTNHYYFPVSKDSGTLVCEYFLPSESDFCNNYNSRSSKFSKPLMGIFVVGKSRIDQTDMGLGKYPYAHLQKDTTRYRYHGVSTMNNDTDIITVFAFVDSLFVTHPDGSVERQFFRSKYQKHENEMLTVSVYDYVGIENHLCSQTSYDRVLYDPFRDYYYVVVSRPMNPENEDGTRKKLSEKPWSLIVLNRNFKQLAEIDMPVQFSKHELMIVPEGLAIMDISLTKKNNNVFVICDIY